MFNRVSKSRWGKHCYRRPFLVLEPRFNSALRPTPQARALREHRSSCRHLQGSRFPLILDPFNLLRLTNDADIKDQSVNRGTIGVFGATRAGVMNSGSVQEFSHDNFRLRGLSLEVPRLLCVHPRKLGTQRGLVVQSEIKT